MLFKAFGIYCFSMFIYEIGYFFPDFYHIQGIPEKNLSHDKF